MKISIDIPEEHLAEMVKTLVIKQIGYMLNEWAVSAQAKAAIMAQWKAVEERIIAKVFDPGNVAEIERNAVARVSRSLAGRSVRRGKNVAFSAIAKEIAKGEPQ